MEIQSFTIRHISNQVLSNTLTPDIAQLIIEFLPLNPNQTNINGKRDGVWKRYCENGQLRYEGCYKNGKRDGVSKWWYDNGQLEYEKCYKDCKMDGVEKWWHDNGQIECEWFYKDDKMEVRKAWYENGKRYKNGQLISEECYKDGKKEVRKVWYENGQLHYEECYKDGKMDGVRKEWHENGQIEYEKFYKYGKECILNPVNGRYVLKTGKTGKKILKEMTEKITFEHFFEKNLKLNNSGSDTLYKSKIKKDIIGPKVKDRKEELLKDQIEYPDPELTNAEAKKEINREVKKYKKELEDGFNELWVELLDMMNDDKFKLDHHKDTAEEYLYRGMEW